MENYNSIPTEIIGILLASGSSQRFGSPKQLIDWKGKYLINHVIDQILESEISRLIVVLGDHHDEIVPVLDLTRITLVRNKNWQIGKSSSIKAGISHAQSNAAAAIFFVVDQPYINPIIIDALIHEFRTLTSQIIVPRVNGQMSNPVLFSGKYFNELSNLADDQGGKTIIQKAKTVKWLEWGDQKLMVDIDSKEEYLNLKRGNQSDLSSF